MGTLIDREAILEYVGRRVPAIIWALFIQRRVMTLDMNCGFRCAAPKPAIPDPRIAMFSTITPLSYRMPAFGATTRWSVRGLIPVNTWAATSSR